MNELNSKVTVNLHTTTDGSRIHDQAGTLFFYDPFIDVPMAQKATANARCTLPEDITLLGVFPHYHARGVGYRAFLDPPSAPPAASPFYTSTDWSHPAPWTGGPLHIAAGTAIRWYCDYDNTTGTMEYLQGPSATNNEMCMFTGAYYPAMSPANEECRQHMDMFGGGTATCADTLSCLGACPPGSAPSQLSQGIADVSDCWQRCFVKSCPQAATLLLPELSCIGQYCKSQCAAGGNACTACAQTNCLSQSIACLGATCGG
jgi:hypothetical protein